MNLGQIGLPVLTFMGYKQTDRQAEITAEFTFKLIFIEYIISCGLLRFKLFASVLLFILRSHS